MRRKRGNRKLVCSGCGRKLSQVHDLYEREGRDLPCFEYRTRVVIELYRVRCPDCGIKTEKVPQLPSKAPFSKRFEEAVGLACESASSEGKLLLVSKSGRCLVLMNHRQEYNESRPRRSLGERTPREFAT